VATFRQRDGRWQAIIRRVDLKATKTFDRKADAQAWARAREREADLAEVAPAKVLGTLGPLIDRYEKEVWPVRRWGLNKANELKTLRADLGVRLLSDLKPGALVPDTERHFFKLSHVSSGGGGRGCQWVGEK